MDHVVPRALFVRVGPDVFRVLQFSCVVGWLCVGNVGWLSVVYVCGVSAGVWTYTVQLLIMSQPTNHTL